MKSYRLDPNKLRHLTPEEERRLAKARIDYSDIPPLGDEFFAQAKRAWPTTKQQVTLRLDTDVLSWLKNYGKGYQTRINHILRAAMESQRPRRSSASQTRKKMPGGAARSRHQPKH